MKDIKAIINDVAQIYRESGDQAEEYLRKARRLKELYEPGFAVVYCWFYSVPQKWTQIESKVIELTKKTNYFDLNTILTMSKERLAIELKPMIFRNKVSLQLENFCKAIRSEYSSWTNFADALRIENIFMIFEKLRKYKSIRLTFKNLSAMKIFVGMNDDLIILDTHVAKVLGISEAERSKYMIQKVLFQSLLDFSQRITDGLGKEELDDISMAKWSLAIWFNGAKTSANELLKLDHLKQPKVKINKTQSNTLL